MSNDVFMDDADHSRTDIALKALAAATGSNAASFKASKRNKVDNKTDISTKNNYDRADSWSEHSWLRSTCFTPDGTAIIAQSDDHKLHTFILPQDVLDAKAHQLKPIASKASPSSLLSYAVFPNYDHYDSSTTWILSGSQDVPTQLRAAYNYNDIYHSYPWPHPTIEVMQSANSLAFVHDGTKFVVGTRGRVGVFEVERPGEMPVSQASVSGGLRSHRDKGHVMALAISEDGLLAAGTTNRNITLWSKSGQGETVTSFGLAPFGGKKDECSGGGVTRLKWSLCQTYLFVAERQSDCIQVFDIRNGGGRLARLSGYSGMSTQKFDFSIIPYPGGSELWSGGMDGKIKVWTNPGMVAGEHQFTYEKCIADVPVGCVSWHPWASLMATCHGGKLPPSQTSIDEDSDVMDALDTLKLWTVA